MAGQLMLVNPKRRKRRKTTKRRRTYAKRRPAARKRRRNPIAKVNPRRRRRNPAKMKLGSMLQNSIMPAATAAGGAIGIDVLMGVLPLPAALKTGPMRHLVKGAVAIGAGMLAQNFVKARTAELFVNGALTVTMYGAGREMIGRFMPGMAARMGLGEMGVYYDDDDLMGLGYGGAGYTGVDYDENDVDGLGVYYDDEDLMGLGQGFDDDDMEEFDL